MGKLFELRPGWRRTKPTGQAYSWKYGLRLGGIHDVDSKGRASAENDACWCDAIGWWIVGGMWVNCAWIDWFGGLVGEYSLDCWQLWFGLVVWNAYEEVRV
jgi:hypothetical protein